MNIDVFFSLSSASNPQLWINLKSDVKPAHVKIRNYSGRQRKFLRKLVVKLPDADLVHPNPTSKWSSVLHLVSRPGSAGWHFTVHLRPVNRCTHEISFPMPVKKAQSDNAAGAKIICEFDMTYGYWHLIENNHKFHFFMILGGTHMTTHVMHENSNANLHLHERVMSLELTTLKTNYS